MAQQKRRLPEWRMTSRSRVYIAVYDDDDVVAVQVAPARVPDSRAKSQITGRPCFA